MVALTVLVTIATAGCAHLGYASWGHFKFSMKANWNQAVGWSPVASPEEAAQAAREGGWWGDEIPVWPIR